MTNLEKIKAVFQHSERVFTVCLGLFSFLIIPFPKFVTIGLIFLVASVIYLYIQKKIKRKIYTTHLLFILLYLAYVIGIFFAFKTADGLKYAEYKLVFLLIPILFSFEPQFKVNIAPAIKGLILGVITTCILGYFASYSCVQNGGGTIACWTSSSFSYIHHPSYFSSYILIAIAGAWLGFFQKWQFFNLRNTLLFTVFGLFNYILCFSLAGLLFLFLVFGAIVFYLLAKKFNVLIALGIGITTLLLSTFILSRAPKFQVEFQEMKTSNEKYFSNPEAFLYSKGEGAYIMGNEVRLIMWTISTQLIFEHPFGVGTGNVDFYMEQKLKKYKMDHIIEFHYNPHNQYLQTALEIGIVGLLLFIGIIVSTFIIAFRYKSYFLVLIISALAFHSLFESIFQRQSGVVFYTFWILLLIPVLTQNKTLNESVTTKELEQ